MSNQWAASVPLLARACHLEPTLAVTSLTALLSVDAGLSLGTGVLVTAAVFTGQLSIGWSNDVIDEGRDRLVQRPDKPIASGRLESRLVRRALLVVTPLCVVLSLLCGWRSGLTHLVLGVGSGWAYNLGLKATALSWLPYAVAFGSLPAVVWLALPTSPLPPWWLMTAAALLGVGAHLVNALPDLSEDLATGVRGLPHRLGARRVHIAAAASLVAASAVVAFGPGSHLPWWLWAALAAVVALAAAGVRATGETAFRLTVLVALLDVGVLLAR